MGMKERLEEIRAGNAESYQGPESRPADGRGPSRADHPWWSIWTAPRPTIRAIVADDPSRWIFTLALLSGFGRAVARAATRDLGDRYPLAWIVAGCVAIGFLMQAIAFTLGGAVLHLVGAWMGSRASGQAVRAALAWSSVPLVAASAFWALILAFYGKAPLTAAGTGAGAHPEAEVVMGFLYAQQMILLIWSLVLGFVCLAEVLRFSLWRVAATLALSTLLLIVILAVPVGLAVSWFASQRPRPQAVATVTLSPARRIAEAEDEAERFVRADHRAHMPDPEWGPVVRAIWDEGYKVAARVDRERPGGPVVALRIEVATTYRMGDDVMRHLRLLPDLRELELFHAPDVTDAGMANLGGLVHLRKLQVFNGGFTDAGLGSLAGMSELEELRLPACQKIDGSGLARLARAPRLRSVGLPDCRASGEGLLALRALPALRDLDLSGMRLGDADLAPLAGLPLLERLDLGAMNPIRGPGLVALSRLPRLRELRLSNDPLTDDAVLHLLTLKSLDHLDVGGTGLSPEAVNRLRSGLPGVEIIAP